MNEEFEEDNWMQKTGPGDEEVTRSFPINESLNCQQY